MYFLTLEIRLGTERGDVLAQETAEQVGRLLLIWDKVILPKRSGWNCKLGRLFDNNRIACWNLPRSFLPSSLDIFLLILQ